MNEELKKKLDGLRALMPLMENDVDAFEDLVFDVADMKDPDSIGPILLLADDNCPLAGIMGSMLESLEGFSAEVFLPRLMGVLPTFRAKSAGWCRTIVRNCLWSVEYQGVLAAGLGSAAGEIKAALSEILEEIASETADLATVCEGLQSRLQKTVPENGPV